MKKVISLKEILVVLISVILITVATTVFAADVVLGDNNTPTITENEYNNAQTVPQGNNTANTSNNAANNLMNNNNNTDLPQTGIQDYNIAILLVIGIASAVFAYKKISDYKNV